MRDSKNEEQGELRTFTPSRRCFLKSVGAGTIATVVAAGDPGFLKEAAAAQNQPPHNGKTGMSVQLSLSRLPVLRKADVVIIGGVPGRHCLRPRVRPGGAQDCRRMYLGREIPPPSGRGYTLASLPAVERPRSSLQRL